MPDGVTQLSDGQTILPTDIRQLWVQYECMTLLIYLVVIISIFDVYSLHNYTSPYLWIDSCLLQTYTSMIHRPHTHWCNEIANKKKFIQHSLDTQLTLLKIQFCSKIASYEMYLLFQMHTRLDSWCISGKAERASILYQEWHYPNSISWALRTETSPSGDVKVLMQTISI